MAPNDQWLPLSKAAALVGVHPTTLRRWADSGQISFFRTPGGHRRFLASDLEAYDEARKKLRVIGGLEKRWAGRALEDTRHEIRLQRQTNHWLLEIKERDRDRFRMLGRRLLGLTMQHVGMIQGESSVLEEAERIGVIYAEQSRSLGISLLELLRILFFFRDTVMQSALELPITAELTPEANQRLFRRMTAIFNTVQLSIVERYQQLANASDIQDS